MQTNENKKYYRKIEEVKEKGYSVFKGVGDGENPDVWHAFYVWRDCGFQNIYLLYDWQRGNSYYFLKESHNRLLDEGLPKNVKVYDVYNVKTLIKDNFPYLNEAKKFAERLKEKVISIRSPKLIKEFENEEFFQVVNAFLDGYDAYAYYFDEEKKRIIAGEYGAFVEWMRKHKYHMRKPEWFAEDEECDESDLEPDVDFNFF